MLYKTAETIHLIILLKEGYVSSKCSGKCWEKFYSISGTKKDSSSMGTCVLNHNTLPISVQ